MTKKPGKLQALNFLHGRRSLLILAACGSLGLGSVLFLSTSRGLSSQAPLRSPASSTPDKVALETSQNSASPAETNLLPPDEPRTVEDNSSLGRAIASFDPQDYQTQARETPHAPPQILHDWAEAMATTMEEAFERFSAAESAFKALKRCLENPKAALPLAIRTTCFFNAQRLSKYYPKEFQKEWNTLRTQYGAEFQTLALETLRE